MKINKLKSLENNPFKSQGDKQIKLIAESIQRFEKMMLIRKIVIDENNEILGGNKRYFALKSLGYKDIPDEWIDKQTNLTTNEKKEFIITDNAHYGSEWDFELLDFMTEGLDLSLEDLGVEFEFDDELFEGKTDDDAIPEEVEPICKTGDLWKLGEHRLLVGDATKKEDVEKLMDGEKADICFTSPPYNAGSLNIKGQSETQSKYINPEKILDEKDYNSFLIKVFGLAIKYSDEVFINIGLVESNKRSIIYLLNSFISEFKDIIYWKKSTVAPHIQNGIINNLVEFIFAFGNGKRKFKNANFSQGTCWNVVEGKNASGNEYSDIHKATFPIYLPDFIIKNFTKTNQLVLDNFIGTGTTLIACEKTNRKCYGMEIDPHYCDVTINRWQDFTGNKAVKL